MEVTHPRWRVRGQRQRSPAAASTILHLHNNHTLEENRRCGNYNQQPTRGTQPHTILHLHKKHTQEKTWRCGLSYQQPTTGTTNNQPQLTTIQRLHHAPQQPHPGAAQEATWRCVNCNQPTTPSPILQLHNNHIQEQNRGCARSNQQPSSTGWWIKTGDVANTTDN